MSSQGSSSCISGPMTTPSSSPRGYAPRSTRRQARKADDNQFKSKEFGDLRPPHETGCPPKRRRIFRGSEPVDGYIFTLFALAALAGGFVSGFSGFAMGLIVSGVWLHIITPMQTATLIAGYGLLTQGYGIFKLRHALDLRKAWPLALGTIIGIPIGVNVLAYLN